MTSIKWQMFVILFCALSAYSLAQTKYPSYFKGVASYNNGNYQEAIQHFNTAENENISKEIVLEIRGKSYLALNDFSNASKDFQSLSSVDVAKGSYLLAQCYALQGSHDMAIEQIRIHLQQYHKMLKSDIRTNMNFESVKNSEAWIELWKSDWYNHSENHYADALYHFRNNEPDFALDILDQLIEKRSNNHKALALRAEIFIAQEEYKAAIENLSEAIEIKDKIPEYYATRASVLLKLEKNKNALEDIRLARKLNPYSIEYPIVEANTLFLLENYKEATEILTDYLTYFPDNSSALYTLGKCLYMHNKLEESLKRFSQIIEKNPGEPKYFLARGNVNMAMNLPDKAIEDYSMALDLDPKQEKVYFSRAFAYQELNDKDRACRDFRKAFSLGYNKALIHVQEYCGD